MTDKAHSDKAKSLTGKSFEGDMTYIKDNQLAHSEQDLRAAEKVAAGIMNKIGQGQSDGWWFASLSPMRDEIATAIAAARAEGRKQGLLESHGLCKKVLREHSDKVAFMSAINDLIGKGAG